MVLFVSEPMFEKKLERRGLIFYQVRSVIRISITNIDRAVQPIQWSSELWNKIKANVELNNLALRSSKDIRGEVTSQVPRSVS